MRTPITESRRSTSSGSRTSGPLTVTTSERMWRSRTSPRRPPYQASSARSDVPQAGSRASRKVRRLERMRRMATRLWWTRSTSLARRWEPCSVDGRRLGPQGTVGQSGAERGRRWRRRRASTSSSSMSFNRKVRAAWASTRWSTIPAVGSVRTSSISRTAGSTGVGGAPPRRPFFDAGAVAMPETSWQQTRRTASICHRDGAAMSAAERQARCAEGRGPAGGPGGAVCHDGTLGACTP